MGNICSASESADRYRTRSDFDDFVPASSATSSPSPTTKQQVSPFPSSTAVSSADTTKLDPRDLIISRQSNTTIRRLPGSLCGQGIAIEDCTNSHIYICDMTAQVTVDNCIGCHIFIGPTESSVFIRDCSDCTIISISQQLRIRSSHSLRLWIYVSAGQPVIEDSDQLTIDCIHDCYYTQLNEQFHRAGLNPWDCGWANIHDFTADATEAHWKFDRRHVSWTEAGMKDLAEVTDGVVTNNAQTDFITPYTWGSRAKIGPSALVCAFNVAAATELVSLLLPETDRSKPVTPSVYILRTRAINNISGDTLLRMIGNRTMDSSSSVIIAMELCGPNVISVVNTALSQLSQGTASNIHIMSEADGCNQAIDKLFAPIVV